MLVGLDSIVDIACGSQRNTYGLQGVDLYIYKITHYGEMDQNFNTDLCAAITNRLQAVLQEGVESED